ncbi:MAG: hypothetical protein QM589_06905 [Thermomicrobiales bacterium]
MKRVAVLCSVVVTILVLTISWSSAFSPAVVANQRGPTVSEQATGWAVLCGMHGGTPRVTSSPIDSNGYSWIRVYCSGGKLAGISCYYEPNPANSECYFHVRSAPSPVVSTIPDTPGVLQSDTPGQPMLAPADTAWVSTPMEGQGVVLASVNACTVLEGTPEIGQLAPDGTSVVTHCEGGSLDGQWCHASAALVTCAMESAGAPLPMDAMPITESPTDPASGPVATTPAVTPTTDAPMEVPTVAPTADTPMPTMEPPAPEPTPTMEPGLPTPEPTLPVFEEVTPTPPPLT